MNNYIIINGELCHYGVKGMKWGERKASSMVSTTKTKFQERRDKYVEEHGIAGPKHKIPKGAKSIGKNNNSDNNKKTIKEKFNGLSKKQKRMVIGLTSAAVLAIGGLTMDAIKKYRRNHIPMLNTNKMPTTEKNMKWLNKLSKLGL